MKTPAGFITIKPERRESIRQAIQQLEAEGKTVTAKAVFALKGGYSVNNEKIVRWYKKGLLPPLTERWDGIKSDPSGELIDKIKHAKTNEDLQNLANDVAIEVVEGRLTPQQAQAVKVVLQEARMNLREARAQASTKQEFDRLMLVNEDAAQAAQQIDLMIDQERRNRVLALVSEEYDADVHAHPNMDQASA